MQPGGANLPLDPTPGPSDDAGRDRVPESDIEEPAGDSWGFEIGVAVFVLLSTLAFGTYIVVLQMEALRLDS